jgi:hypothetical protein
VAKQRPQVRHRNALPPYILHARWCLPTALAITLLAGDGNRDSERRRRRRRGSCYQQCRPKAMQWGRT